MGGLVGGLGVAATALATAAAKASGVTVMEVVSRAGVEAAAIAAANASGVVVMVPDGEEG